MASDFWPPLPAPPRPPSSSSTGEDGDDDAIGRVAALAAHAAADRTALLVLVRRGGWAVGVARGGELLDGVGGTRYVQSRTAAGGWSQQRYARRRANQADALVGAAAGAAARVLAAHAPPDVVVPGGDRQLVADVLAAAAATTASAVSGIGARGRLDGLPHGPLLDVPDPRRAVLVDVARRARCVRVRVGPGTPQAATGG